MVELTLITLLNSIATEFCMYRDEGNDTLKSVLLAYSYANEKYGGTEVRKVIKDSVGIEAAALAAVVTKCPNHL